MRFVVIYATGPAWSDGATLNQQPLDEHLAYIGRLFQEHTLISGGPFTDDSGGMAIVEAPSLAAVRQIVARDPAIIDEIFELAAIHPWHTAFEHGRASLHSLAV